MRSLLGIESHARPVQRDIELVCGPHSLGPHYTHVSQDGPLEIFDVMCSHEDVIIELSSAGGDRPLARLSGPWLRRREVALVELLQIANDLLLENAATKTATMVEMIRLAIESAPMALVYPISLMPSDTLAIRVADGGTLRRVSRGDLEGRATTLPHEHPLTISVWIKAVQWVNR